MKLQGQKLKSFRQKNILATENFIFGIGMYWDRI